MRLRRALLLLVLLVGGAVPIGAGVAAPAATACFAETGHCVAGRFLDHWLASGGLARNGFPLGGERREVLEDGNEYVVQYFERARFERHPENAPPYNILLGQFGRAVDAESRLLVGEFGRLYTTNERVRDRLGAPLATQIEMPGATQVFEQGRMIWRGEQRWIYVLCGAPAAGRIVTSGNLPWFVDTWTEGQPIGGGPGPQPGLYEPGRGFGTVWRERNTVRQCVGYATGPGEASFKLTVQDFERGVLLGPDLPAGRSVYAIDFGRACNSCSVEGSYELFPVSTP